MEKKDVLITLNSVQAVDGEKEETELITGGSFERDGDRYIITYDESTATGFDGSTTVLTCTGNECATMSRSGTSPSNLIIERGKKHHCHYGTPFGEFMVGINAHTIENTLNENGGELTFKYTIDVNSVYVSDNEVRISVQVRE